MPTIDVHTQIQAQNRGEKVVVRDPATGAEGTVFLRKMEGNVAFFAAREMILLPLRDERLKSLPEAITAMETSLALPMIEQYQFLDSHIRVAATREVAPGHLLVGWDPKNFNGLPCKDDDGSFANENARLMVEVDWIWQAIAKWCVTPAEDKDMGMVVAGKKSDTSSDGKPSGEDQSADSADASTRPKEQRAGKKK